MVKSGSENLKPIRDWYNNHAMPAAKDSHVGNSRCATGVNQDKKVFTPSCGDEEKGQIQRKK
ncbi:MAG: hypothetical protein GY777_30820 [Candidatus Brocadiaceae bacterium]|nr:hypothetical protein [Candidatus Brocadiaceae bacterium]